MKAFKPTKEFDFTQVYLDTPQPIQGGSFLTKLLTKDQNPVCFQLPNCVSKQGFVTTKKNIYCDLQYDNEGQESLIDWILALETHCQHKIYEKSDIWFNNDVTKEDIENLLTPVYRLHNSGKKILIRTYIDVGRVDKKPKCLVYNEQELQIDTSRIMAHTSIIPLVLIEGVKFSSKNFDIVMKLKQVMVIDDVSVQDDKCLISNTYRANKNEAKTQDTFVKTIANNEIQEIK